MDYQNRLEKVKQVLKASECDALLVDDPVNLYYLTGITLSEGKLVIKKDDAFLLVDNRYFEHAKKIASIKVFLSEITPFESVLKDVSKLAFDSEKTTYQNFLNLEKSFKDLTLMPLRSPIQKIRCIKDPEEIALIREAVALGFQGFYFAKDLLTDGVSEKEIATELEIFWKRKGGQGLAFEPIIGFGENSALPHHRAGETPLKQGMAVLMDIGIKWKMYHSDLTRTLFWGEPPPVMHDIYSIVKEAQNRALAMCKPGILIGDLDLAARDYIHSKGYGENFMHSLGHGVGLNIHEWPLIRKKEPYQNLPLEEGMVITIEPGIYLPGIGGVRIEDMVLITSTGHEILQ